MPAGALWLALCTAAAGQAPAALPAGSAAARALLAEGRAALLSFRLDEAERAYARAGHDPTAAPFAYHALSTISLARIVLTEEAPLFDRFFGRADTLFSLVERMPASPWRVHLLAEAHFLRAFAQLKADRHLRAAMDARKAYLHYEENVRRQPDFYESYRGLGLLHVLIGSIPGSYRWILRALGYGGDVQQGLRELRQAAAKSRHGAEEAQLFLALADVALNQSREGGPELLRDLGARHPDNPLFAYLHGYALLANRSPAGAEAAFRRAIRQGEGSGFRITYAHFLLGESLFKQNRFAEAERSYRRFVAEYRGASLKALARYRSGLAFEMEGRRPEALAHYRAVRRVRDSDNDHYAARQAALRLARPMDAREQRLLRGANASDGGQHDEAMRLLAPLAEDPAAPADVRAGARYHLARAHHAAGRLDRALALYAAVLREPGDPASLWVPWSHYYTGEIHAEQGRADLARAAFQSALRHPGPYDYGKSLEQRTKTALGRL